MSQFNLTILLYHGVTNSIPYGIENISGKHIHVDEYFDQMSWLKKNANILSMEEVYFFIANKKAFPKNAVAVTFDDGFENNYSQAFPVLKNLGIPTTFYISSGMIGTNEMFWVDKLEDCINHTQNEIINIVLGEEFNFELKQSKQKINALKRIKTFCKASNNSIKEDVIKQLIEQTGHQPNSDNSDNYRVMNWQQLIEMSLNENVIIGGHSLKHEILSRLDHEQMKKNIELSVEELSSKLNINVEHYSYPEGQSDHYNEDVINILRDNGVKCCPSAVHGINSEEDDLFHLKRIMVGFGEIEFPKNLISSSI